MPVSRRKALGAQGEARAAAYLHARSYHILARNWRCSIGEADIIAQQGGDLVIIEVRTRRGLLATEQAIASITPAKQLKLMKLAYAYQLQHDLAHLGLRIDVVTVALDSTGAHVELIESAVSEE